MWGNVSKSVVSTLLGARSHLSELWFAFGNWGLERVEGLWGLGLTWYKPFQGLVSVAIRAQRSATEATCPDKDVSLNSLFFVFVGCLGQGSAWRYFVVCHPATSRRISSEMPIQGGLYRKEGALILRNTDGILPQGFQMRKFEE